MATLLLYKVLPVPKVPTVPKVPKVLPPLTMIFTVDFKFNYKIVAPTSAKSLAIFNLIFLSMIRTPRASISLSVVTPSFEMSTPLFRESKILLVLKVMKVFGITFAWCRSEMVDLRAF